MLQNHFEFLVIFACFGTGNPLNFCDSSYKKNVIELNKMMNTKNKNMNSPITFFFLILIFLSFTF
ncbi:hypothetical protein J6TS2_13930 [Heyndrickxia sporothermodurans]|nr:hypothetical protein J6TS2_13930 [Heyndrickxia sporothermodurans]